MKIGIYQHYKGNLYRLLCIACHTETNEKMVVYSPVDDDTQIWIRPLAMFEENVLIDEVSLPRFRYLEQYETKKNIKHQAMKE